MFTLLVTFVYFFFNRWKFSTKAQGLGLPSQSAYSNFLWSGPAVFEAVWNAIQPPLAKALQTGINQILKNISISDIITPDELWVKEKYEEEEEEKKGWGGRNVW